jgi:hypothetical protein
MTNSTLPTDPRDIHHIYNDETKSYDVICLKTGDIIDTLSVDKHNIIPKNTYSPMKADIICNLVREGVTLANICKRKDMPSSTLVYHWLATRADFKHKYMEARKQRAEVFHDKALEVALTPMMKDEVPAAKLAVDTLKWAAEKNDPDRFGKKDTVEHTGQAINITLHTGVLDTPSPVDIIVDEFGNFKGFDDGTQVDMGNDGRSDADGGVIELQTDRWRVTETRGTEEGSSQEGEGKEGE